MGSHTTDQHPHARPAPGDAGDGLPAVTVRYFAAARQAAGTGREQVAGGTVGAVLDEAVARHGPEFARVLSTCRIWVNGEEAGPECPLRRTDEVALLPPVSGGLS